MKRITFPVSKHFTIDRLRSIRVPGTIYERAGQRRHGLVTDLDIFLSLGQAVLYGVG